MAQSYLIRQGHRHLRRIETKENGDYFSGIDAELLNDGDLFRWKGVHAVRLKVIKECLDLTLVERDVARRAEQTCAYALVEGGGSIQLNDEAIRCRAQRLILLREGLRVSEGKCRLSAVQCHVNRLVV